MRKFGYGIASFFFPGLGQLCQGRGKAACGFFVLSCVLWCMFLGWIGHLLAAFEAFGKGEDYPINLDEQPQPQPMPQSVYYAPAPEPHYQPQPQYYQPQ